MSARSVALGVITAVDEQDAYANLLLPPRLRQAGLDAADAAFATELTYGTLRMRGYYDLVIAISAGRPVSRIDPGALAVLRLGAHQLLGMRVPAHAAVDESVRLARRTSRGAAGFVNAVLRAISRDDADVWRSRVLAEAAHEGADAVLAAEHSHPVWVVRALREALEADERAGELAALLAADNTPARVTLTALPGLVDRDGLGAPGHPLDPTPYSPVGAIAPGGDPSRIPAVAAGRARVQDEGSALAALALSRARPIAAGERWLDLCAGPGGKAALLAAEAARGGATLVANELVPARAGLVRNAVEALGDAAPVVTERDGTTIGALEPGAFDRILLDAPCSGIGALRRRPEARWRKSPRDIGELTALQSRLLASAAQALAPGGLLAYVTCSPHVAETTAIVAAGAAEHGLVLVDTPAVLRGFGLDLPDRASAQLWPHAHGTDAMFVQLLTR